ncbi:cilia- and flagella-associated protein 221-like isoform X2 [Hydractinia symbiolongicarpus]|uniref:cilia- and flagella-associated protein 221-like isoform X2 n=1 Tax=Hydractinia symbiolongicarpus TaxID=13093 RepID=UPI00254D895F|nr:cilia- and flagella-associated protein 221-like isoform X2 [Hydractinia symbiolongicarpus]
MAVEASNTSFFPSGKENMLHDFVGVPDNKKVENHLLDTNIYTTIGENELLHVRPCIIHFDGFEAGGRYLRKLRIINASGECQRMHIIPPSTDVFKIKYKKTESFVPGMYLEVLIEFAPTENRYHCDCIQIHTKGTCNLIVPIHAYLVMNISSSFPSKINFQPTHVGQTVVKKIVFKNNAAADFDFQIGFVQKQSVFSVEPTSGLIPAHKHVDIFVSYTPMEYCTTCAKIQVMVSQFNYQPFYCSLTGSSQPGLASRVKLQQIKETLTGKTRVQSPLERSRTKKQTDSAGLNGHREEDTKEIIKDGIRFPRNLNNPSAVAYVLTQQPGKMKAKDLKDAVRCRSEPISNTKQMKEAIFDHLVCKNMSEEQRNQLRWCVKVGEGATTDLFRKKTIEDREKTIQKYKFIRGDPQLDVEFNRMSTIKNTRRIRRVANEQTEALPTFDLYLNDDWRQRYMVLKRFIHAARKVIVRLRAVKNLNSISKHLDDWRRGQFISAPTKCHEDKNKEQVIVANLSTEFNGSRISPFAFPVYKDPNEKDDMAVDALGVVPVASTSVVVKSQIETYSLKVPQQYKILSYDKQPFTSVVYRYVPKCLVRRLRTGAESEITQVKYESTNKLTLKERNTLEDVQLLDITTHRVTAPSIFLQQKQFHPLHVFNPLPGVQAYPQRLPYSEVDDDYQLNPLPRTEPGRLDRHDVIPGLMSWKRFPSHGLVVMNGPSLCNVYVPRWTDPFGEELTSSSPPPLLPDLPDEDVLESDDEDTDSPVVVPTMEMLKAEFKMADDLRVEEDDSEDKSPSFPLSLALPGNNNPQSKLGMVSRDKLVSDLDFYLRKKENNVGERIKSQIESTRRNLDLK